MAQISGASIREALGSKWKEYQVYTLSTPSRLETRKREGYTEVGKLTARFGEELIILEQTHRKGK